MKKVIISIIFAFSLFLFGGGAKAASLEDGKYVVKSALNESYVLSAESQNKTSNVNISWNNNVNTQKWNVKHLGGDYYTITNDASMTEMDVNGAKKVNGTNVGLYYFNGTNAQKWLVKYTNDGYYNVISACNNLYLDVTSGKAYNGNNVQMYKGNSTYAQKWKFIPEVEKKQTISDGTYNISSLLSDNFVLDLASGKVQNGSNIQIYSSNDSYAQLWDVKYNGDGTYIIQSHLNNSYVLDVKNGKTLNKTNVWLYQKNNSAAQKWIIRDAGGGYYNIVSALDNMYLDLNGANASNASNIQIYHSNGSAAQKFKFSKVNLKSVTDGYYTIKSVVDKTKVVGTNRNVAINGTNVQLMNDSDSNSQKWYIKSIGSGYYTLENALGSSKMLDVHGANTNNGTNIWLYSNNGSKAQKWILKYNDDDTFSIVSALNGSCLDIHGGNMTAGTNIWLYQKNNSAAQKFILEKTERNDNVKSYEDGYYIIQSTLNNSYVLDARGATKFNGTNVQLYKSNYSNAQIWKLSYQSDGSYKITSSMNPNISLDVSGAGLANGSNVQLYKSNDTLAQRWIIRDYGDDIVSITSKINGLNVDVKGAKADNYTNVQMYENNESAAQKFKLVKYTGKKVYKGFDVSQYQKDINWEKIAKSDIDFVIIRAGFGRWWNDKDQTDKKYKENVAACEKYNIPYGLYLYSYARSADADDTSAKYEAQHMLMLVNDIGLSNYKPTLGTQIFYDIEDKSVSSAGKQALTEVADKFCFEIQNKGFKCGIYANEDWLINKLDSQKLSEKYEIWLAKWPYKNGMSYNQAINYDLNYTYTKYKYWQFADNGSIDGISTKVDLDLGYDIFD